MSSQLQHSLLLVGNGGHCVSCIDVIESSHQFSIAGFVLEGPSQDTEFYGYPILGTDADLPGLVAAHFSALITVGQIHTVEPRKRLYESLVRLGANLPVVVSSSAYISKRAQIGDGTIVMHGAIVNASARVGVNCILNSQALIEHGAVVGDHCHISTGAKINGDVVVGSGSFIGSGAVIKHGIHIGENVVIEAGQMVLAAVPNGSWIRAACAQ